MVRTRLLLWCGMQPQFIAQGAEPGLWDLGTWIWHLFLETNLAYMLFFVVEKTGLPSGNPCGHGGRARRHTRKKALRRGFEGGSANHSCLFGKKN